ncbi:trans-sialidase, putative, partial [Trypanosoma cruzi marinkellei]
MGVNMNGDEKTVLLGLSYNSGGKCKLSCGGGNPKELSSTLKPETTYQVAIVRQNSTQGTAYVDGQRVGEQCELENTESKEISHFYIGGDGGSAEGTGSQEGVSVTVTNVLLYNRPLEDTEIKALNAIKVPIPNEDDRRAGREDIPSTAENLRAAQDPVSPSTHGVSQQTEKGSLRAVYGEEALVVSKAASVDTTLSVGVKTAEQLPSG